MLGEFAKATKVESSHRIEMSPASVSESQFAAKILAQLEREHEAQADGRAVIEKFETALAQDRASRSLDGIIDAVSNGRVACLLIEQRVGYAPSRLPLRELVQINTAVIGTLQMGGGSWSAQTIAWVLQLWLRYFATSRCGYSVPVWKFGH